MKVGNAKCQACTSNNKPTPRLWGDSGCMENAVFLRPRPGAVLFIVRQTLNCAVPTKSTTTHPSSRVKRARAKTRLKKGMELCCFPLFYRVRAGRPSWCLSLWISSGHGLPFHGLELRAPLRSRHSPPPVHNYHVVVHPTTATDNAGWRTCPVCIVLQRMQWTTRLFHPVTGRDLKLG